MDKKNTPDSLNGDTKPENHQANEDELRLRCEEYKNDLKRLAAEFDNYKKRVQNQSDASRQMGREDVLLQVLLLNDEFSHALEHTKSESDKHGFSLLSKKLSAILSSFGVEEIKCANAPNPNEHEVVLTAPGNPQGNICQVLRKGYKIGGRLLRPAQVSVYSGEDDASSKCECQEKKCNRESSSNPHACAEDYVHSVRNGTKCECDEIKSDEKSKTQKIL